MAKLKRNLPLYYILQHSQVLINDWSKQIDDVQKNGSLKDLCVAWDTLWTEYEQIDKKRKELLALFDKLNEEIIPKAFEDAGVDKIAVPELKQSFYPLTKYSASISNNSEAFAWLREHQASGLISETVNRNSLAAYLKDRLLEDGLDPPSSMKLESYKITGSSKYTPKGN